MNIMRRSGNQDLQKTAEAIHCRLDKMVVPCDVTFLLF
jgi:hypothetical protein